MSPAYARRRQLMMVQNRGLSVDLDDHGCLSSYNNSNNSLQSNQSTSSSKHTQTKPTPPNNQVDNL